MDEDEKWTREIRGNFHSIKIMNQHLCDDMYERDIMHNEEIMMEMRQEWFWDFRNIPSGSSSPPRWLGRTNEWRVINGNWDDENDRWEEDARSWTSGSS